MGVAILNQQSQPAPCDLLRQAVQETLQTEVGCVPEVCIVLSDDSFIADLNQRYRQTSAPTDVLAFPQLTLTPGELSSLHERTVLGDVVISVPTAARQAAEYGWSLAEELALLGIHGTLHLLGYRDEDEVLRQQMQTREDDLFQCLFARSVPRTPPARENHVPKTTSPKSQTHH
ncbi:MAG TPA: rRNA maturation RNase YbeY [Armatimonadetes bacterium]|nr:rRNA maturation RNase YbeY [Armatimonadota bacterium]